MTTRLPTLALGALLLACAKEQPGAADTAARPPIMDSAAGTTRTDSTVASKPAPKPTADVVTATAFGPLRIGMTVAQAQAALPGFKAGTSAPGATCTYATAPDLPKGLSVMLEGGKVVRFDVKTDGVSTTGGVRVGDSENQVQQLYGDQVKVSPHKYEPAGHYLTITAPDDTLHRTIFETKNGRVTSYRAGQLPQVAYVEGCG